MLLSACAIAKLSCAESTNNRNWTLEHEHGRCAIRGQCGKKSFFGGQLPCPDNGLAQQPSEDTRAKLVSICGEKWKTGNVCCDEDQVSSLKTKDWIED